MKIDGPSDMDLIISFSRGDENAFRELYNRYKKLLYGYLNNMIPGNPCEADEVFAETWTKVIEKLPKYRDDGKFSAWLFRMAHNIFIDRLRRNKPEKFIQIDAEDSPDIPDERPASPVQDAENADLKKMIDAALASLPPEQREVFLLREQEMSFKEIAAVQNCSQNTALSRMQYALKALRKFLSVIDNGGLIK